MGKRKQAKHSGQPTAIFQHGKTAVNTGGFYFCAPPPELALALLKALCR
jgi:hypothetical protein